MTRVLFITLILLICANSFGRELRHMTTPQKIQLLQRYIQKNFNAQHRELLEWNKTGGLPAPELPSKLQRAYLHQIKLLKAYSEETRFMDSKKSLRSLNLAKGFESLISKVERAKKMELENKKAQRSSPVVANNEKSGHFEVGLRVLVLPVVTELSDSFGSEKIISRFTGAGLSLGYSGGEHFLYRAQGSYIFGVGNVEGETFDYNQERATLSGILIDLQVGYALGNSLQIFAGPTFKSLSLKTQESATEAKEAGAKIAPALELRYITDGAYFSAAAMLADGVGFGVSAGFRF